MVNSAEALEGAQEPSPRGNEMPWHKSSLSGTLPTRCLSGNFLNQFLRIHVVKSDRSDFMCDSVVTIRTEMHLRESVFTFLF